MEVEVLRERLHEYINTADEQHLTAIYVLVGDDVPEFQQEAIFDEETMKMLYQRRENHKNGTSKSYSAQESIEIVRQSIRK